MSQSVKIISIRPNPHRVGPARADSKTQKRDAFTFDHNWIVRNKFLSTGLRVEPIAPTHRPFLKNRVFVSETVSLTHDRLKNRLNERHRLSRRRSIHTEPVPEPVRKVRQLRLK